MEDCHSVKLSRLLALTVLNGSLFRLSLTGRAYSYLHCFSPALSQARRGPTHPVRGRYLAIALDRRLVRLSSLIEELFRGEAVRQQTASFYTNDSPPKAIQSMYG